MGNKILNADELYDVLNKLIDKIHTEVVQANATGEVQCVFKRLGYEDLITENITSYPYIDTKHARILVIAFQLNLDDLRTCAKSMGFDINKIDFVEFKSNFNYASLRYSAKYSDVLVGPIPHNGVGIGDYSSFLAAYEKAPHEYPKVQRLEDSNGTLKVTKTSFKDKLKKTRYYNDGMM